MQAEVYFDARLIDITTEDVLVFEFQGSELRVPGYPGAGKRAQEATAAGRRLLGAEVGSIGLIRFAEATEHSAAFYRFEAYFDQTMRRAYELDTFAWENRDFNAECIGWRNETKPDGFLAPRGVVPGTNGDFIPDETTRIHLDVPVEFVNLCDEYRLSPEEVLRGFIADACGLQNYFVKPRADGYSSNGSDERSMAYDYLERAHAMKRSEYDS